MIFNFKPSSKTPVEYIYPHRFKLESQNGVYWSFLAPKNLTVVDIKCIKNNFYAYCFLNTKTPEYDEKRYEFQFVKENEKVKAEYFNKMKFIKVVNFGFEDIYIFEIL